MDAITHTLITGSCMIGCYVWGRHLSKAEILESIVESMFNTLENEGFIRTEIDENGEKELIPISEIISKSIK
tara:strand:+ start:380 stop:595 length:216 start_codon:yes stop_codon:yes gene_type:complete